MSTTNSGSLRTAHKMLTALLVGLSVIYMTLVMFPNVPVWFDRVSGGLIAPQLYLIQLALGGVLFVVAFGKARKFVYTPFALWTFALLLVYIVAYLRLTYFAADATADDIAHAVDRLQRASLIPVFCLICFVSRLRQIQMLLVAAVVLVPLPVILGFFDAELFPTSTEVRSAGTYFNANQAGEAVLLWLVLIHRTVSRRWLLALYLFCGAAVFFTFSRAGVLAWVLLGTYFISSGRVSKLLIPAALIIGVSYAAVMSFAEDLLFRLVDNPAHIEMMMNRLDVVGQLAAGDGNEFDDASSLARGDIAWVTWQQVLKKPLLGYGYEVERDFGLNAHNMPLQAWYTYGLAGLFLYLWLAWLLFRSGTRAGFGLFSPFLLLFLFFSLFDHSLLTDNYWLITYAVALSPAFLMEQPQRDTGVARRSRSPRHGKRRRRRRRSSSGGHALAFAGGPSGRYDTLNEPPAPVAEPESSQVHDEHQQPHQPRRRRKRKKRSSSWRKT